MCQGVYVGSCFQCWWYSVYYIGIDKGYLWNIVWVDIDEFVLLFFISDDIVNCYFCCGICGGWYCEDWYVGLMGG